jgi:GTP-binding protein
MKVTAAEFIGAATEPGRFPVPSHPEVAFAGRSNVGKSSAINRLLGRRGLARTSATPGRTRQLNFFRVDDRLVFVDLPGYGYARASHAARAAWRPLVESYLAGRGVLAGMVLLVDARRGIEDEERALVDFLGGLGRPVLLVATKVDKLNRRERTRALAALAAGGCQVVAFSAVTGEGADAVWRRIAAWTAPRGRGTVRDRPESISGCDARREARPSRGRTDL